MTWNFKSGNIESVVDQLADPKKFPDGRMIYDNLVAWGVGSSINTLDRVFFKAGFLDGADSWPIKTRDFSRL